MILGSMSPDFEYFLALEPRQTIGHTFKGLLVEAIPLSIIIIVLVHLCIRSFASHLPSIANLDTRAYERIKLMDLLSYKSWIVFLLSVVVGFYSHLFVDAFTHASGYFVQRYPTLQNEYGVTIPLFQLLQYLLSLIGMMVELILLVEMLFRTPTTAGVMNVKRVSWLGKITYWSIVLIVAFGIVAAKLAWTASTNMLGIVVVAPITGVLAGIVAASLICRGEIKVRK